MSRNPEIESILEAWWQAEHCHHKDRFAALQSLNTLLDKIVVRSDCRYTRDQVLDCLHSQYQELRLQRRKSERVRIAQSAQDRPQ